MKERPGIFGGALLLVGAQSSSSAATLAQVGQRG